MSFTWLYLVMSAFAETSQAECQGSSQCLESERDATNSFIQTGQLSKKMYIHEREEADTKKEEALLGGKDVVHTKGQEMRPTMCSDWYVENTQANPQTASWGWCVFATDAYCNSGATSRSMGRTPSGEHANQAACQEWCEGDANCNFYLYRYDPITAHPNGKYFCQKFSHCGGDSRHAHLSTHAFGDGDGGHIYQKPVTFTVHSGECQIYDGCVRSPHCPSPYRNNEQCSIGVTGIGYMSTAYKGFSTEADHDKLIINGQEYHGDTNFQRDVRAPVAIQWTSDGSGTKDGWSLCPYYIPPPIPERRHVYDD